MIQLSWSTETRWTAAESEKQAQETSGSEMLLLPLEVVHLHTQLG